MNQQTNSPTKEKNGISENYSQVNYYKPHMSREDIHSITKMRPLNLFHYRRAFVHKSIQKGIQQHPDALDYMKESYERYEYLGDSILNMVVAEYLFEKFKNKDEGFLTKMRTKLVNGQNLGYLAKKLNLGKYILMGYNVEKINGRENIRILEDVFEALICAIKLDLGINNAKKFIIDTLESYMDFDKLLVDSNYKDMLLRFCQKTLNDTPNYEVVKIEGPPHNRFFSVVCVIQNGRYKTGFGKSKKEAEQESAYETLVFFNQIPRLADSDTLSNESSGSSTEG